MNSTFNLAATRPRADVPMPHGARTEPEGHSYFTSSFDLRAGLETAVLGVSQLPAEVLRELVRLRASWAAPASSH